MARRMIMVGSAREWVLCRQAILVVDTPDDIGEADAEEALVEYIDENLDGSGKMDGLFGPEYKFGDPEDLDTAIIRIEEAPPDAEPDLRLRFVEDDNGGRVEVEFVGKAGTDGRDDYEDESPCEDEEEKDSRPHERRRKGGATAESRFYEEWPHWKVWCDLSDRLTEEARRRWRRFVMDIVRGEVIREATESRGRQPITRQEVVVPGLTAAPRYEVEIRWAERKAIVKDLGVDNEK